MDGKIELMAIYTQGSIEPAEQIKKANLAVDYFTSHSVNIKASSKSTYNKIIKLFMYWAINNNKVLNQLTKSDIASWRDDLCDKGKSASTIALYITALRCFYNWIEEENLGTNIARGIKTPKKPKGFKKMHIPQNLCSDMLSFAKDMGLRDYAIINLALRTGARVGEIANANIGDITYKGGQRILKVLGKGRATKDDYLVLTDKAYRPIREYLATRPAALQGEPLFISSSNNSLGKRLTTRTISDICKRAIKEGAGLDGKEYTAHSMRHTTAVIMLNNGIDIYDIQQVLRHTSPLTTEIYLESVKEERRLSKPAEAAIDLVI